MPWMSSLAALPAVAALLLADRSGGHRMHPPSASRAPAPTSTPAMVATPPTAAASALLDASAALPGLPPALLAAATGAAAALVPPSARTPPSRAEAPRQPMVDARRLPWSASMRVSGEGTGLRAAVHEEDGEDAEEDDDDWLEDADLDWAEGGRMPDDDDHDARQQFFFPAPIQYVLNDVAAVPGGAASLGMSPERELAPVAKERELVEVAPAHAHQQQHGSLAANFADMVDPYTFGTGRRFMDNTVQELRSGTVYRLDDDDGDSRASLAEPGFRDFTRPCSRVIPLHDVHVLPSMRPKGHGPFKVHNSARREQLHLADGGRSGGGRRLEKVKASHMRLGNASTMMVPLPSSWAKEFLPWTVQYLVVTEHAGEEIIGRARLLSRPDVQVAYASWRVGDATTFRHLRLSKILAKTGAVPLLFANEKYPGAVFLLSESPGNRTLRMLIEQWEAKDGEGEDLVMPLNVSLPLMIDMMRALLHMENHGIVHLGLDEDHIYVDGDERHVVFADLRSATLADRPPQGSDLARVAMYRRPPELEEHVATRISSSVWQLGIVFARMLWGGGDKTPMEAQADRDGVSFNSSTLEGRRECHEFIKAHFALRADPRYGQLRDGYLDVLSIVFGMLRPSPDDRLSVREALAAAIDVAQERGIPVYPPREPLHGIDRNDSE